MFKALKTSAQSGFTLVEVAISVVIIGIVVAGIVQLMDSKRSVNMQLLTNARMEKIMHQLSVYVDSHGRLPCPANPSRTDRQFGWEWNFNFEGFMDETSGPGMEDHFICNNTGASQTVDGNLFNDNNTIGVVPFLSLGLDPEDIKDGWGNYFTYAVSPVYSFDDFPVVDPVWNYLYWSYGIGIKSNDSDGVDAASVAYLPVNVSAQCRTYGWVRQLNDNNKSLSTDMGANGFGGLYGNEAYLTDYDWRTTGGAALWALDPRTDPANYSYKQIRRNIGLLKAKYCCSIIPTGTLPSENPAYPAITAADGTTLAQDYLGKSTGVADYAPATDLVIESSNEAGVRVWSPDRPTAAQTSYGEAGDSNGAGLLADYPGSNPFPNSVANKSIVAPAFVLVSHGPNGKGAYLVNGTFDRNGVPAGASEQENVDLDRTFVDNDQADGVGGDTFDDIVMWMTQDNILAYNGTSSCGAP